MDNKKEMGFFEKLKIAIFKLEDYANFLAEKWTTSFKYFLLLMLLISVIIACAYTLFFSKGINKAYSYIKNEMPNFTISEGILKSESNIEAYDEDFEFKLFINTDDEVSNELLKDYETKIYDEKSGLIILKDKFIYITSETGAKLENEYSELLKATEGISITNKQDIINMIDEVGIRSINAVIFGEFFIQNFIINFIQMLSYVIVIIAFGYIVAFFWRIKFKFPSLFTLAIYSSTLSIVLTCIYAVVNIFTSFSIKYFDMVYLLIAYIYMTAAILMIRYDLIKQNQELQKIIEVQKEVEKELEEQEEKEKKEEDNKKEDDKTKDEGEVEIPELKNNNEPDGSEI